MNSRPSLFSLKGWSMLTRRTIRRDLVVGIALVHAVLMTLFVADLMWRYAESTRQEVTTRALGLARMVSVNSVSWVLANDVSGLNEVIRSVKDLPDIRYAMVIDPRGRVLAHTDGSKVGLYVVDGISRTLLTEGKDPHRTAIGPGMIETAAPVASGGRLVGWVRISIDRSEQQASRRAALRDGLLYTGIAIIAGILVALWMARWLTRDLRHLAESADRLRTGERTMERLVAPPAEVADLEHRFQAMATTIWEREDELRHTIEQLATSNADLERFAYIASHDLQTPLRSVASYAQLLERQYRDQIDGEGREFLGFVIDGAKRMSAMIHDLLAYSRVSSRGRPLSPVAVAPVLEEVVRNLRSLIDESGATVTVGELPVVLAEEAQLASLLQNLIENAIKYRAEDRPPRVTIAARREDPRMWRISVADNGMGIDPEEQEEIFAIFRRGQNSAAASEGTGIGLAICRQIVNRMGGKIWVESTPGQGATFHIMVRAAEDG